MNKAKMLFPAQPRQLLEKPRFALSDLQQNPSFLCA